MDILVAPTFTCMDPLRTFAFRCRRHLRGVQNVSMSPELGLTRGAPGRWDRSRARPVYAKELAMIRIFIDYFVRMFQNCLNSVRLSIRILLEPLYKIVDFFKESFRILHFFTLSKMRTNKSLRLAEK